MSTSYFCNPITCSGSSSEERYIVKTDGSSKNNCLTISFFIRTLGGELKVAGAQKIPIPVVMGGEKPDRSLPGQAEILAIKLALDQASKKNYKNLEFWCDSQEACDFMKKKEKDLKDYVLKDDVLEMQKIVKEMNVNIQKVDRGYVKVADKLTRYAHDLNLGQIEIWEDEENLPESAKKWYMIREKQ